jgi:hypothetical protein
MTNLSTIRIPSLMLSTLIVLGLLGPIGALAAQVSGI